MYGAKVTDPAFVFDSQDRLWQLDRNNRYYCNTADVIVPKSCTLTELVARHGPINHITKGPEVRIPETIPNGSWVQFNAEDVGGIIWGTVASYYTDSVSYDIVVKIGRDKVSKVDL
jgi:hypothetical protein